MMEGWKTDKLGLLCKMYQPQTIATSELNENGRYLVYDANGIIGRYDKYNHEESQLLMTCRGNTCGEITVTKPFSWINGNAMVISPINHQINIKYLEYYLKHISLEHIITGGAQPQITRTALRLLKVSYPESFSAQTAIANILSKVDEAIASVQGSIDAAERLKKSLMQNLLTGRMKPDGTLRKEDEFYVDEKFGKVPMGWEVKAIGDKSVCQINPNYKYKKKELYDFATLERLKKSLMQNLLTGKVRIKVN